MVRRSRSRGFVLAAAVLVSVVLYLATTHDWHRRREHKLAGLQAYGNSFRHGIVDPHFLFEEPKGRIGQHEPHSDTLVLLPDDYLDGKIEVFDDDLKKEILAESHLKNLQPPPPAPINDDVYGKQPPGKAHEAAITATPITSIVQEDEKGRLLQVTPTTTIDVVHWSSMKEHYPVPSNSLVHLPTGTQKNIPRIQHQFGAESPEDKQDRQLKLDEIKSVMNRTWYAYRKYAWRHDEIMPLKATQNTPGKRRVAYRDPFAGWGATLVDTLDTLWIMGMKEEFGEAVEATMDIDFTTSSRSDIPVFETTIRYMGGLLGAYDISGQQKQYHGLVDKAIELAEILMGAFDTPNRMPVMFYQWRPENATLPKKAATSVSLAEIGSLSLEFTRLAQITGEQKYYDAIARVMDYFRDFQDRTLIPGLWDNHLDASGCATNWTLAGVKKDQQEAEEEETRKDFSSFGDDSEDNNIVVHVDAEGEDDGRDQRKDHSSFGEVDTEIDGEHFSVHVEKRQFSQPSRLTDHDDNDEPTKASKQHDTSVQLAPVMKSVQPSPTCVKFDGLQSLQGDSDKSRSPAEFGLGGGADSTYEYLPKQWILLGGLEDSYRKMYEKALAAFNEYLFFQPMINDSVKVTFASSYIANGKVTGDGTGDGHADGHRNGLASHLACFTGGMVALGAKIFGHEADMKLAERLAEGCVWAYGTTPMGVMSEEMKLLECPVEGSCEWNQTYWYHQLDFLWDKRAQQIEEWETKEALERARLADEQTRRLEEAAGFNIPFEAGDTAADAVESGGSSASIIPKSDSPSRLQRRQDIDFGSLDVPDKVPNGIRPSSHGKTSTSKKATTNNKKTDHNVDTNGPPGGPTLPSKVTSVPPPQNGATQFGSQPQPQKHIARPPTHEQFVEQKIKNEHLYPGVMYHNRKEYILRPEALEGVFYLYRTTGNPAWRQKGWRMFKSIEKLARTEVAYSSVYDVTNTGTAHNGVMESFWTAETLKYIWLLFESEDVVSLDDWVLNTEAHPFRRGDAGKAGG